MNNALKLLFFISSLIGTSHVMATIKGTDVFGEEFPRQAKIINSFRNSLGFNVLTEDDIAAIGSGDSLLAVLEQGKQYDAYFELERIIIKYQLFKGETRMAIAHGDEMYSKAKALDHQLGLALSLNAIGEVYSATGRNSEAGKVYKQALSLMNMQDDCEVLKRILLLELAEYYLRMGDGEMMSKYITRLNECHRAQASVTERAVLHLFNAYYLLETGALEKAGEHLNEIKSVESQLNVRLCHSLMIAEALYLERCGKMEEALQLYERFFEMENIKDNYHLYIGAIKGHAALLEKMGRKEEAFDRCYAIYSYMRTVFKTNYPKEIDQLSTRFQADHLAFENERARSESLLYYNIAIVGCVLILLLFIFLSWRKIFFLKRSTKNKEKMKLEAENAIRKKNLFLSNMSHEVRTPLNAIVGFSTLMVSEDVEIDEVSRKEYCDIIKVNSYQLLKLINDIIDFSDFDDDNIPMNICQQDAVKICREVMETIAASYKLQVELRFETVLSSMLIETDDARLRQVLINLLVNATKFTQEGSITLELKLNPDDERMALFTVTDTGCGIPVEKQKLIFERFEKLNDFVQGTGLGLSICLLIMRRLKGRIWIDENYTKGARFCFLHPIKYETDSQDVAS